MVRGKFIWKFGGESRWMRTTGIKLSTGGFDDAGVQGQFQFALPKQLREQPSVLLAILCNVLAGSG
jgi:hypothetical protein